jgi:UPF0716 protein FxsA|tara:strand:+ start:3314 stop:3754 length:441 start_codon:yes stop_codon:yes gene_type:complete
LFLLLIFIALPIIEISLFIHFGSVLGTINTILLIFLTAIIGVYLVRLQGFNTINQIKNDLNNQTIPVKSLFNGLVILVSGLLLLIPGFFTDFIGFLGLIPLTRNYFGRFIIAYFFKHNSNFASEKKEDINEPIEADYFEINDSEEK